jgi:transcription antitermination factor NusG
MGSVVQSQALTNLLPGVVVPQWYAIQTRSRHEKKVSSELQQAGIQAYLPMVSQVHRWSDRRKVVDVPLFPGYAFVQLAPGAQERMRVLRIPGVLWFVGNQGAGAPIPESEISDIRVLVSQGIPFKQYPFLKIGQRVRIRGGALDGIEGILVGARGDRNLIVSVNLIQRSVALSLEGYDLEEI